MNSSESKNGVYLGSIIISQIVQIVIKLFKIKFSIVFKSTLPLSTFIFEPQKPPTHASAVCSKHRHSFVFMYPMVFLYEVPRFLDSSDPKCFKKVSVSLAIPPEVEKNQRCESGFFRLYDAFFICPFLFTFIVFVFERILV